MKMCHNKNMTKAHTYLYLFGSYGSFGVLFEFVFILYSWWWPTGLRGAADGLGGVQGLQTCQTKTCTLPLSHAAPSRFNVMKKWSSLCWLWPGCEGLMSGCL